MSTRILPKHTPLPTATTAVEDLGDFLQHRYADEMQAIITQYRHTQTRDVHKNDLFFLGHRAAGFKLEVSAWLAEAQRLLQEEYTEQLKATREQRDDDERRPTVEMVKSDAKQSVSSYQKAVDQLKFARDDLKDILSYCRETIKGMRDEEFFAFQP